MRGDTRVYKQIYYKNLAKFKKSQKFFKIFKKTLAKHKILKYTRFRCDIDSCEA